MDVEKMEKLALGTVAGGIAYFLLGGLIYGLLLTGFYEANLGSATDVMRDTPIWGTLVFSQFALGALVTYVLLLAKVDTLTGGLKIGAAFGLLLGLSISFDMYSVTNWMNLTAASVDSLVWMARVSLGAGGIGLVLGMGTKRGSPAGPCSAGSPAEERRSGWIVTDRTDAVTYGALELRVRDDRYLRLDSLTARVDGRAQWKVVEVMRLPQLRARTICALPWSSGSGRPVAAESTQRIDTRQLTKGMRRPHLRP